MQQQYCIFLRLENNLFNHVKDHTLCLVLVRSLDNNNDYV